MYAYAAYGAPIAFQVGSAPLRAPMVGTLLNYHQPLPEFFSVQSKADRGAKSHIFWPHRSKPLLAIKCFFFMNYRNTSDVGTWWLGRALRDCGARRSSLEPMRFSCEHIVFVFRPHTLFSRPIHYIWAISAILIIYQTFGRSTFCRTASNYVKLDNY